VVAAMPRLAVVKPARKSACAADAEVFAACLGPPVVSTLPMNGTPSIAGELCSVIDGVSYIDNVLTPEECVRLCTAIDSSDSLSFWSQAGRENEDARRFRDADTIEVDSADFAATGWTRIKHLVEALSLCVADDECDVNWERELVGEWAPCALNHDLLFARYPPLGSFAPHTDGRAVHDFNTRSFYSVILFLNTIPSGQGGTRFYQQSATQQLQSASLGGQQHWTADPALATAEVDAVAGRLLIFHQSLVHEGVPALPPHQKYIVRSDVMCLRSPALCDSPADREAYRLYKEAEDLAEEGRIGESIPLFKRAIKMSASMARIMGQG